MLITLEKINIGDSVEDEYCCHIYMDKYCTELRGTIFDLTKEIYSRVMVPYRTKITENEGIIQLHEVCIDNIPMESILLIDSLRRLGVKVKILHHSLVDIVLPKRSVAEIDDEK